MPRTPAWNLALVLAALTMIGEERPAQANDRGACERCHPQRFKAQAFMHGPIAVGQCTFCHRPHKGTPRRVQKKDGARPKPRLVTAEPQLCFRCHDRRRFSGRVKHGGGAKGCSVCHDPHGGSRRFFVRQRPSAGPRSRSREKSALSLAERAPRRPSARQ